MRVFALAGRPVTRAIEACHAALDPNAPDDYRQLAALLADEWCAAPPRLVGLGGGQGAGKSTLAALIEAACAARGLRCGVLALDDFYLDRAARRALAQRVHPLLETRGPPGTHDIELLGECASALLQPGRVEVPVFDKGSDERAGWRSVATGCDLVLIEGWCVGARASALAGASSLARPINALEAERDPQGVWRRFVDAQLASGYADLFGRIDVLTFLRVPDLGAVRRWRLEQEQQRAPGQRLTAAEVDIFVAHYERITLAMLEDLPGRASVLVDLDAEHRVAGVRLRQAGGARGHA